MDAYNAIMKAANHIERSPLDFDFWPNSIPRSCGTSGCASGWIGFFSGRRFDTTREVCAQYLGIPEPDPLHMFLRRMDDLSEAYGIRGCWHHEASICACVLRLYAAKYHAPGLRTDAELVAALMHKLSTERIPEDTPA